jgi:hypothetical protein
MRTARVAMAITGVLLATVCLVLGAGATRFLVGHADGGNLAGTIVLGVTAAFLLAGGTFLGYAFVRAAIRMKATTEMNPRRSIRSSVAGLVLTAGFWLLPMPGISLAERIFVCLALIVIVLADMAMELEPPRRKRR